jgi:GNAT superfamily N-acetyltransferase
MPIQEHQRGEFLISTDKSRLDIDAVHAFLSRSFWAQGIPREIVARSIEGSLCFGIYEGNQQIGFARVISDFATYAYLGDVYVLEEYRGQGLSKWLMECIMGHPDLEGLRRWSLSTRDAHGLYRKFGFELTRYPECMMEILDFDIYKRGEPGKPTS